MKSEKNNEGKFTEKHLEKAFARLNSSNFRSGFKLNSKERVYLKEKGLPVVVDHGKDFIEKRLAPAVPVNDGKQTPWGGHPVFRAQHATATCCRSCLLKWHGIPKNKRLSAEEKSFVIGLIRLWLSQGGRLKI